MTRRGRVLVVDDDEGIRSVLARALQPKHDVVTVAGGPEALAALQSGAAFDVILCDLMMPGMSGREVLSALQHAHPEHAHRVVFISGGATTREAQQFLDTLDRPLVRKPFNMPALRQLIARFVE